MAQLPITKASLLIFFICGFQTIEILNVAPWSLPMLYAYVSEARPGE